MKDARIERLYVSGEINSEDFRSISDYIVERYVYDPLEGEKLTPEQRDVISEVAAIDMAIGAESKKVEYLLIGGFIGFVATIIILKIGSKFNKEGA